MNFDMAGEMLEMEGIKSTTVLLADDVASAPSEEKGKRRGTGGLVYALKLPEQKLMKKPISQRSPELPRKLLMPAAQLEWL